MSYPLGASLPVNLDHPQAALAGSRRGFTVRATGYPNIESRNRDASGCFWGTPAKPDQPLRAGEWWALRDSNPQPTDYESAALTD